MARTKDKERVMLVDVSAVANSAQALRTLESFISTMIIPEEEPCVIELNCGGLLITPKIFSKITKLLRQHDAQLDTVYALLPQTQQAALDSGLSVREKPRENTAFNVTTHLRSGDARVNVGLAAQESVQAVQANVQVQQAQSIPQAATGTYGAPVSGPSLPFGDTMSLGMDAIDALDREFLNPMVSEEEAVVEPSLVLEKEDLNFNSASTQAFQPDELTQERPTLYLEGTLRSGQVIRYDGNLVIVGDVHGGSEIAATGNVMVWGELRGLAHAGARGDRFAEIRALKIEAVQLRVADVIARRPDRIFNHKQGEDKMVPVPEVARITDGEIKIFNDVIGR